jgi:hypothetical protein
MTKTGRQKDYPRCDNPSSHPPSGTVAGYKHAFKNGLEMLSFEDTSFGVQECQLNLAELYPDSGERSDFEKRFEAFVGGDEVTRRLFELSGDRMKYRTEVFVSDRIDDRPPLMLLLGNPASHSIASDLCFAFEKSGSEHRFWKVLREVGILNFLDQATIEARRKALLELQYDSPFRVSIAVFYSIPSPASSLGWSGVSGVRRLLGARAFKKITYFEEKRIQDLMFRFISPAGGIIAFQKDAYDGVRSQDSPAYSRDRANQGVLVGEYKLDENIRLAGSPPTRLMQSARSKWVLKKHRNWLCERP